MATELTSEEIVTELLISNSVLNPVNNNTYMTNPNETLGDFLLKSADVNKSKPVSKYSFIDESINWGF